MQSFKSLIHTFCSAVFLALMLFSVNNVNAQTLTVDTYTTSTTWVVPPCVTSITVRAWGGGGAGGGASAIDRNGGGGGGGAYCTKVETVTPGETLIITVGAGGTGVSSGTGNSGGFSQVSHSVGPVVICRAAGGAGGQKGSSSSTAGAGGAGGAIANNIPAGTGFSGGNGGASDPVTTSSDRSGGGGGGAGSGSNGGNGGIVTAGIAGSPGGGAGGAGISTTTAAGSNGSPGNSLGGGGGGSTCFSGSARAGAAGAAGQITITYTATGCEPAATTFSYTTVGTHNWIVPICVNYVTVEVFGGGGGGGGNIAVLATSGGETCTGAGGGGGGGYAARTYPVVPGESYTIVVGAGGAAGAAGVGTTASITTPAGAGGVGQSSTFSGPATAGPGTLTGLGGNGGAGAGGRNTSSSACLAVNGAAGTGGAGVNGTVNYTGGNGAAGLILDHSTDKSGGGGGGAGPGGNGGTAPSAGSVGVATPPAGIGNPPGGTGGTGRMWNTPALSQQSGVAGSAIGGGGGGSLVHTSALGAYTAIGGVGGRGEVRLTYNTSCPLPIELMNFSGTCKDNLKTFNWSTATEHNNEYFTLQHSKNGSEFYPIQIIEGAGNSNDQVNYSAVFTEEDQSYVYYRLKQTDTDGESTYSDVVYAACLRDNDELLTVSPNPSTEMIVVNFGSSINEKEHIISITDMTGKIVFVKDVFVIKKGNTVLDISSFSNGYYFLNLIDKNTGEQLDVVRFSKID